MAEDNESICDNCGKAMSATEGGDCQECGMHCCADCLPYPEHDCEVY